MIAILASNPFFDAYIQSDLMGKVIFLGLVLLSIWSWTVLIYKAWMTFRSQRLADQFLISYEQQKKNPLALDIPSSQPGGSHPFLEIYLVFKKQTLDILNKNRHLGQLQKNSDSPITYLSTVDIDYVESHVVTAISQQVKQLEKNLFILSTVVTLAPFLGLLGTVWGILTTFADLQTHAAGSTHQMVLGGISLALATTVIGLLDAIPALIGYNYLKNTIKDFQTEMEGFAHEILSSVEMQYRLNSATK